MPRSKTKDAFGNIIGKDFKYKDLSGVYRIHIVGIWENGYIRRLRSSSCLHRSNPWMSGVPIMVSRTTPPRP